MIIVKWQIRIKVRCPVKIRPPRRERSKYAPAFRM
jgi:hypothetical protein